MALGGRGGAGGGAESGWVRRPGRSRRSARGRARSGRRSIHSSRDEPTTGAPRAGRPSLPVVGLEGRAGADHVAVPVRVVDAPDGRPVLVGAQLVRRQRGVAAPVATRPWL